METNWEQTCLLIVIAWHTEYPGCQRVFFPVVCCENRAAKPRSLRARKKFTPNNRKTNPLAPRVHTEQTSLPLQKFKNYKCQVRPNIKQEIQHFSTVSSISSRCLYASCDCSNPSAFISSLFLVEICTFFLYFVALIEFPV